MSIVTPRNTPPPPPRRTIPTYTHLRVERKQWAVEKRPRARGGQQQGWGAANLRRWCRVGGTSREGRERPPAPSQRTPALMQKSAECWGPSRDRRMAAGMQGAAISTDQASVEISAPFWELGWVKKLTLRAHMVPLRPPPDIRQPRYQ